jgi:hypothetical protein
VIPARVENLKYYNFNGLFKLNNSKVNCSVIKITWDPPSNYNETVIDHYEVTVGSQHVSALNTEYTFIPSDSELLELASLNVYYSVATNLSDSVEEINISVSAVDICGQIGTSSTLQNIESELFCYRHNLDEAPCSSTSDTQYQTDTTAVLAYVVCLLSFTLITLITMSCMMLFIMRFGRSSLRYNSRRTSSKDCAMSLSKLKIILLL